MAPGSYRYSYRGSGGSRSSDKGKGFYIFIGLCIVAVVFLIWFFARGDATEQEGGDDSSVVNTDTSSGNENSIAPVGNTNSSVKRPEVKVAAKVKQALKLARQQLESGNLVEGRKIALEILSSSLPEENPAWDNAADILSKSNIGLFFSDIPLKGKKQLYTVEKGDALERIARKYNTTIEAIQKSNNMQFTNYNIRVGQTLCVYQGDWRIRISKSKFKLYLYDGNEYFKIYHIGIGKQGRTPVGTFDIASKTIEPDWYSPNGKIPYGSKENVLGTRWMKLKPTGTTNPNLRGYGIHGTWAPESIGQAKSNGCIRMKNSDVEELFTIVPYGTEVVIED